MMDFELKWLTGQGADGLSASALTRCQLSLRVGASQLFRHETLLGKNRLEDAITVSAYPLALWFAANWWRLRWEPAALSTEVAEVHDWQMSHQLGAAGEGYAWPRLTIISDGDHVQLVMKPSSGNAEPLRYLERIEASVPAQDYESAIDRLIESTLSRLDPIPEPPSQLHELWQAVLEERADPTIAILRQLEAKLGYDPDEAPVHLMLLFDKLVKSHGQGAAQELACLGSRQVEKVIHDAELCLSQQGEIITLPFRNTQQIADRLSRDKPAPPWEKGREVARWARGFLSLDKGPLDTATLAELLETSPIFFEQGQAAQKLPIGLGELSGDDKARVVLGKTRKDARRFMAARLVAEGISSGSVGHWLPCTDAATARQKFQRAFAQEFLCPFDDLVAWMGTTCPDDELMDAAAEHFEVSSLMVHTVMVNCGYLSRSELDTFHPPTLPISG